MSKNKGKVQEAEPEPEPVQNDPVIETGKGEFLFPNGARYLGEWKSVNGIKFRHGEGEYQYGPEVYSGQWSDDKMCGAGKQTFSSGAYYDGEFKDNMFEGNGIYRFPEGATYRGSWHFNKMHGDGVYTDAEGVVLSGTFFNGMYNSGKSYISVRPVKKFN